MNTKNFVGVIAVFLMLGITGIAQATILGTYNFDSSLNIDLSPPPTSYDITIIALNSNQSVALFNLNLDESAIGNHYFLTNGMVFDAAVTILTDGIKEPDYDVTGGYIYNFNNKYSMDFKGFNISSFELIVNALYWTGYQPFIDHGNPIVWSGDANENFTLLVHGDSTATVPEPSTMLLLGGGLAGLAFWRKRKSEK